MLKPTEDLIGRELDAAVEVEVFGNPCFLIDGDCYMTTDKVISTPFYSSEHDTSGRLFNYMLYLRFLYMADTCPSTHHGKPRQYWVFYLPPEENIPIWTVHHSLHWSASNERLEAIARAAVQAIRDAGGLTAVVDRLAYRMALEKVSRETTCKLTHKSDSGSSS